MPKINLDDVSVTYLDSNSNIIAVSIRDTFKDKRRYRLYRTDNNLTEFELVCTADTPIPFDKILYPHRFSDKPSKSVKTADKVSKIDDNAEKSNLDTIDVINSRKTSKSNLKRKPLF